MDPEAVPSRVSGTCRRATSTTTTASGALMRNTQRHEATWISHPPSERPHRGRDAAQPRPGADRPSPVLRRERRLDHRQAARGQQRPADALQRPGGDQQRRGRGQPAQQRRGREPDHADHEHAAAAVAVAERAAEQDQRREGQRVGGDGPLQRGEVGLQVLADRRQRDVDDRGVDAREPGPEDGRQQDPTAPRGSVPQPGALEDPLIRRAGHPRLLLRSGGTSGTAGRDGDGDRSSVAHGPAAPARGSFA